MNTSPEPAGPTAPDPTDVVLPPDHRLRVFVSSTLRELAAERAAVRAAVTRLRLAPVMFEQGARAHSPRQVYRSYLAQSHVFVAVYGESYGWVAPGEEVSGLEDEYLASTGMPRLLYVKRPAPGRDARLAAMLQRIKDDDGASYTGFSTPEELQVLVENDLAVLLTERFELPSRREQVVPAPALPATPAPAGPIVGRAQELGAARDLILDEDVRLVTLTGTGGVGKSRLALEVATSLAGSFPDGVGVVGLDAVDRAEYAASAIASSLGLASPGTRSPLSDVVAFLRARRALLVLDNLEQVSSVAALLGALLAGAPGLTVLATSRTALRVRGEHEVAVGPLPVPAVRPSVRAEDIVAVEAVRLFVDRARAVCSGFVLTDRNAADVADIVRRLDGLPLALELGAAMLRVLTPGELLARLGRRLSTLSGGPLDLPERQRTLRATIGWSYDLLTEAEQRLFARLGAFAGGFDLAAAEAVDVAASPSAPGAETLETLQSLVRSSLVARTDAADGARFSMLDSVREYARERLRADGAWVETHDAHARYFLELAERADHDLEEASAQLSWLERLERDHDNLRVAVSWLIESGTLGHAGRLAWAVWRFWFLRGHTDEGIRWYREILARADELSATSRARALAGAGLLLHARGDIAEGEALLRRALPPAREIADRETVSRVLLGLGRAAIARGAMPEARGYLDESLELSCARHDEWVVAVLHAFYGQVALQENDGPAAENHFGRALAVGRQSGDRLAVLFSLSALAGARERAGETESVSALLVEALAVAQELGDSASAADQLRGLASLAVARGDDVEAARLLGALEAARGGSDRRSWLAGFNVDVRADDADVASLRARLGDTGFVRARDAGAQEWTSGRFEARLPSLSS
ncbi:hypothetical protein Acsp06_59310 [Actinomycetospora sp. NBRC 106375]|uniref:DUF4062 domain-containing protein n=1 Tax=Actinomycetospora sp. NBRC 106375 TaxID=3032207 RepID=UPI0024A2849E|nr:DUF4062 domain-containing protein [Actinomycetospora sp. NBRC 106375]GLZ49746.1 hypothetical protein Acsp06_59310 [Actinomycetospora sp. NBRC 106375]